MQDREPSSLESIWSGNGLPASARAPREPVGFPGIRSRRSIGGAGAIWRSGTRRCAGHCSSGGKLCTGMGRRPELAAVRKLNRRRSDCAERSALAANFRITDAKPRADGKRRRRHRRHCDTPAIVGSIPKPSTLRLATRGLRLAGQWVPTLRRSRCGGPGAAPETKPATIPGWTIVDVRDGTAVLEGPDGIKMAARGDTIPGSDAWSPSCAGATAGSSPPPAD